MAENTNSALERIIQYEGMQEVSTTNEQKQCSNPETSNAIVRGNTLHIVCQFLLLYGYLHLIVQTVGRASRAECSSLSEKLRPWIASSLVAAIPRS